MLKQFLLVILLILSACVKTNLNPPPVLGKVFELHQLNQKSLDVKIEPNIHNFTLGHQYVFLFFPFGKIKSQISSDPLNNLFFTELVLNGHKPNAPLKDLDNSTIKVANPLLEVNILSQQVSAYDFLVIRRISCSIELEARLTLPKNIERLALVSTNYSEIKTYAFQPQLEKVYNQCLVDIVSKTIQELRLNE